MILKAQHNLFFYNFFKFYSKFKIERVFKKVHLESNFSPDLSKSLLVISNHFSWWDGFLLLYLNEKIFKKKFHFMMLEEELSKRIFLNKSGGFSVKKGNRSVVETLNYTVELLKDPNNMVLIFPQGRIESNHLEFVKFESGVDWILSRTKNSCKLIFHAYFTEYFSDPKPSIYSFIQEENTILKTIDELESRYNGFYTSCLNKLRAWV